MVCKMKSKSFMESKAKLLPELEDEKWLRDWAVLVDLTRTPKWESVALFSILIALKRKVKIMANNFLNFDTLVKHSPVDSEKYSTLLSFLIKNFENRFQDYKKKIANCLVYLWLHFQCQQLNKKINTLPANFQIECIELQSDIQLREKCDHVSLPDFNKTCLTREKYPPLHNHALFSCRQFLAVCTFVNDYFQG